MLKEYSICNILDLSSQYVPYYVGSFEDTEDVNVEWPHRHTFYSLVWFTKGTGSYVIDFEEYEIQAGRIFLVTPKQIHNWDYSEDCEGYILVIDQALDQEINMNCPVSYIDLNQLNHKFFKSIFINLISSYKKKYDIKIDIQYIYQQIRRLIKPKDVSILNKDLIFERYKQLILSDFSQNITTEVYTRQLNISIEELNRLCKIITGKTSKQYILDIKLTEAKRLLLFSNKNINEISFSLGFDDSSYFSRIFKKKTTYSPSDFLRKYRKYK